MPYAIFNVEFEDDYKKFDHVKIDLYSSQIGNEDQRRSFIVWKEIDFENYSFFVQNFDTVRQAGAICEIVDVTKISKWLNDWKKIV